MIKNFKHKGLAELFEAGRTRRVRQDLQSRCLQRLEALDQTEVLNDLYVPGFIEYRNVTVSTLTAHGVSPLSGKMVKRYGSILNNIIEVNHDRILH